MRTKIKQCTCDHEFQDIAYGDGNRVHNFVSKPSSPNTIEWRCTVCGRIKDERKKEVLPKHEPAPKPVGRA